MLFQIQRGNVKYRPSGKKQTDRQRQTDRQIDRDIDRQTDKQTDRSIDIDKLVNIILGELCKQVNSTATKIWQIHERPMHLDIDAFQKGIANMHA